MPRRQIREFFRVTASLIPFALLWTVAISARATIWIASWALDWSVARACDVVAWAVDDLTIEQIQRERRAIAAWLRGAQ